MTLSLCIVGAKPQCFSAVVDECRVVQTFWSSYCSTQSCFQKVGYCHKIVAGGGDESAEASCNVAGLTRELSVFDNCSR